MVALMGAGQYSYGAVNLTFSFFYSCLLYVGCQIKSRPTQFGANSDTLTVLMSSGVLTASVILNLKILTLIESKSCAILPPNNHRYSRKDDPKQSTAQPSGRKGRMDETQE